MYLDERCHRFTTVGHCTLLDGLQTLTQKPSTAERRIGERLEDVSRIRWHVDDRSGHGSNGL